MQVLLGISRAEFSAAEGPGYIRVLGFNETGRMLLSGLKKDSRSTDGHEQENQEPVIPVITNINKEKALITGDAERQLRLDIHASDMYNLIAGCSVHDMSDHRQAVRIL